ncbi:thioredoxin domain-containing protein [Sporohalobacter salinus]|uniref:thioredoxin domain-containing protein n=1 Tax=Sporohalobacter salinus TaxID=1494606 RepID=UPI0019614D98|nr:thioredoxin domain-containing protein [Sporohalobacter salinus]MBM7624901.1 uncharacterized protein YyaL (SSP411 family) [Sporohalobacter salinus]
MTTSRSQQRDPNHLINEQSPYLLQHAYNPVDWYTWSEEAFKKAKAEDKPIFLSIGYSTCHWCHVMERESFEDEEVAEILNKNFVAIKVDREERPDIDNIYMTICQTLTGRGGWPLTVIMTPNKEPFFAGTYFPKEASKGQPGLIDILTRVKKAWKQKRQSLLESSEEILSVLRRTNNDRQDQSSTEQLRDLVDTAFTNFESNFDEDYGGFGTAPKFPTPHNLMFLLRYWKLTDEEKALEMVKTTLDNMYRGGMYDHLGYGFARYSTDEKWLVPHFEKMLYDNALLAIIYLEAYQVTNKDKYADIAKEIFTYILRDMTSSEGGFYSAEDADSEGEEGKFYVWTPKEVKSILGEKRGKEFCQVYDITTDGNFEGKSIPNLINTELNKSEVDEEFAAERKELFRVRENRVHPHKDDKILTSWNGLMIAALAIGARILDDVSYQKAAKEAVEFIWQNLRRSEDGRLLARYRNGEAEYPGYVDDYAFFIWGLIELYETSFETEYLEKALDLNKDLLEYFWDEKQGGLYFYGYDSEELLIRPKEIYDGAIPSGNSVATLNFLRLAKLIDDTKLEEKAKQQFEYFSSQINNKPVASSYFLLSWLFAQSRGREVVFAGSRDESSIQDMIKALHKEFLPFTIALLNAEEQREDLSELAPFVASQTKVRGEPTAYICEDFTCQEPVNDSKEFKKRLQ